MTPIRGGVPSVAEVQAAAKTPTFDRLARYSADYLKSNKARLGSYRWTHDALNHWSRIYEYPYCLSQLESRVKPGSEILDAGCGVTFFPFFLAANQYRMTCVDCDNYTPLYTEIAKQQAVKVNFKQADLQRTGLPDASMDAVYCISVLEHTDGRAAILAEFARVLRPGGRLLITFDISLDGNPEALNPAASSELLKVASEHFEIDVCPLMEDLVRSDRYSTKYVRQWRDDLLPWPRNTWWQACKDTLKGRSRAYVNIDMTFCCLSARKK